MRNLPAIKFTSLSRYMARGTCLLLCLLLAACAVTPRLQAPPVATATAEQQEQTKTEPDDVTSNLEDLPNLELDADLLGSLLTANIASYQGHWSIALQNALSAATSSRDPRVARLAALLALRIDQYDDAVTAASLWVELQAENADANTTLQLALVGAGEIEQALQSFDREQGDLNIDEHVKRVAGLLVRQDNSDAAIKIVSDFVERNPDSAQVLLSAAYVADNFELETAAQQWIDDALALRPDWDLAAQMKASILRQKGEHEQLMTYIREFVEAHPQSTAMRMNLAAELARAESYAEALAVVQEVLELQPENGSALSYAAALAEQLELGVLADTYYEQALQLDPTDEEVRWALARRAVQAKDYKKAERHYSLIASDQNFFRAQLQVANMRYYTNGLKSALITLRALNPVTQAEYVEIAVARHYLLMQAHEHEEALAYVNETLAYLPDNIELRYARGLVAAELDLIDTAEQDFRFILEQRPDHANALNALGYTLADRTDRYEEARDLIGRALELRPNDAHILDSMGWVLYRLQDYEAAIGYLKEAFGVGQEVEIAAHLGEVLWESGEQEEAREVWRNGLQIDAQNPLLKSTIERYGVSPQNDS
ncbi:MAG: tetratricopeptide repeat protein [Gammaproteobacteria bacterium]|nr:tetratricopeptide repeat protein [Gammaproteobacteria bacterium]